MQLPAQAGVMILNTVLFPQGALPLHIFEPRYRAMLEQALRGSRMFVVALQRPASRSESPCPIAGLGLIRASVRNSNGTSNLILQGVTRVKLTKVVHYKPYRVCQLEPVLSEGGNGPRVESLVTRALELVDLRVKQGFPLPMDLVRGILPHLKPDEAGIVPAVQDLARLGEPGLIADFLACLLLRSDPLAMQTILETIDVEKRLNYLVGFLAAEVVRAQKQPKKES